MKFIREYKWYLIIATAAAVIGAVFLSAMSRYGYLGIAALCIAAVSLVYMGLRIFKQKNEKLAKTLNRVFSYGIVLFIMAVAVTEACIISDANSPTNVDADYAIVLGAGVNGTEPSRSLLARLEAALDYSDRDKDTVFILSGGQGPGEDISEAQCMKTWLEERGVDPERLITEDKAGSTLENIKFSREIIMEREPGYSGNVCIITEGYHMLRARLMAMDNGLENVTAEGGSTGLLLLTANYYLREVFAIWYYMLTR